MIVPVRWVASAVIVAAVSTSALLLLQPRPASAIPAWARAYGTDCTTCHTAGFKLSRTGQDFLRAGHRMEGGKEDMGLSDHMSVAQKIRYNYAKAKNDDGTGKKVTNSFEMHALSLYMGGPLQKDFSYFAELYWHENSGNTSGSSDLSDYGRSKLADAYVQYLHRKSAEAYTSVRFGQFSPYLLHMHGVGARLTSDRPYVINSGTVGSNPYKPFQRQYGLEVSQYYKGFNVAGALMNGTGGKLYNRVDNDLKKDVYGTVDYTFDDYGSILGAYGYLGHYPIGLASEDSARYVLNSYDDFNQVGVLGNLTRKQGALMGAFFSGRNTFRPRPSGAETEQESMGYYIEGQIYTLHPRFQPFVRWDFWDADTDVDDNEVSGPTVGFSWRAMDAGRLAAHYAQLKTENANPDKELTERKVVIEVNFMF